MAVDNSVDPNDSRGASVPAALSIDAYVDPEA